GISSIIQYATHGAIKIGYSYFVINAFLLAAAFFIMGSGFGAKTIYAIILASIGLNVTQDLIPQTIIQTLALDNGKLMCTLMGGIMAGLGIGLSMNAGGSTGGTDIIALIVNKYRNVSPGKMIVAMDFVIILSSFFIPSYTADGTQVGWADKFTTVIYGLILVTVNGQVVDLYLSGMHQNVQLFIFSSQYEKIADALTYDLNKGVSVLPTQGWYSRQEGHLLMVISRKNDLSLILRYVKMIDPKAFLSVASISGVYGKGFETIKERIPKGRSQEK
ncbi:MAG: YitT family protein, partial [Bacteroidales bacterium]|nr:YitT family protein [Bacteroidales bacterium]